MNKIYKVIYSKVRQCYVVVSEIAKSHGRHTKSSVAKSSAVLTASVLIALGAFSFETVISPTTAEAVTKTRTAGSGFVGVERTDGTFEDADYANNNGQGAHGDNSITIGLKAVASDGTITIGDRDASTSLGSVYVGRGPGMPTGKTMPTTSDKGYWATSVGYQSDATGYGSIAIGSNATANNSYDKDSTGHGIQLRVPSGDGSITLNGKPDIQRASVAIGYGANADNGNIAIGSYSDASTDLRTVADDTAKAYLTEETADSYVSVGKTGALRRISNVADGAADSDVATIGQLKALSDKAGVYNEGWGIKIDKTNGNTISVNHNLGNNMNAQLSSTGLILGGDFSNTYDGKYGGAAGDYAVTLGGESNFALGNISVIAGGYGNHASGKLSFIGGGNNNVATGSYSANLGGTGNTASGESSVVTGGAYNTASGTKSFVGGGHGNIAVGDYSAVIGGWDNRALGDPYGSSITTVVGGYRNTANGYHAMVTGGYQNVAWGRDTLVSGGRYNTVLGEMEDGWTDQRLSDASAFGGEGSVVQGLGSVGLAGGSTGKTAYLALAAGYQSVVTDGAAKLEANFSDYEILPVYKDIASAIGYQSTANEAGTISFGHDAGDVSGYTVNWEEDKDPTHDAIDYGSNDYTKTPTVTENHYDDAYYNRLVKVADGIDNHDAVTREQVQYIGGIYGTDKNDSNYGGRGATGTNSVAIGSNAVATEDNVVSFGNPDIPAVNIPESRKITHSVSLSDTDKTAINNVLGFDVTNDENWSKISGLKDLVIVNSLGSATYAQDIQKLANNPEFMELLNKVNTALSNGTLTQEQCISFEKYANGTEVETTDAVNIPAKAANYRRVVNMADVINPHDAVAMEQLEDYAKTDASNIGNSNENKDDWGEALGVDSLTTADAASNSNQLITGKTLYNYDKPNADGTYVKLNQTTGQNLSALDTQVKANTDALTKPNHNIKYYAVDETTLPKLTNFNGKDYSNEKNNGAKGMGSIAAGFNTHADGIASTVAGSYSGVINQNSAGLYDLRGATALSYGTFNINQNTDTRKIFSGVANSIVGQANATTDSNAAIIYGAGNTVTNSYRKIDDTNASEIMKAALSKDVKKLDEALQKAVPTSGGQVMVMGGGNNVESAYMTQVVGVGNTVKGNQVQNAKGEWVTDTSKETAIKDYDDKESSQYNYVDGFNNEVINGKHDYIIGANNTLTGDSYDDNSVKPIKKSNQSNIVIGDNHTLDRKKNTVIIGSSDTANTVTNGSDAVIIGHNANAASDTGADNAVAIGLSAKAAGGNAVSIGANTSAGADSVTIGSVASAVSGSNIAIGRYARVYGNKVTNAVALGQNANALVADGVAIGSGSQATVKGDSVEGYDPVTGKDSTDATATWKAKKAAVSIGTADGKVTRQINGLAAGTNDTDAVNVAQLKKLEGMKANVDATNIGKNLKGADGNTASAEDITANEKAWGAALGTGDIATPKDMLVTDKAIHDELRPTTDGTYVKGSQTTAENLSKLDAQVKTNTDGISTNTTNITKNAGDITKLKNLSNITNEGEKVIKKLSKDAVKVEAGDRVTVTSTDNKETGTITYKVSANNNGTVTAGDQNLVSGDTVNTAINNAITNAGTATDTKLAGKANVDATNIGKNLKGADGNTASAEDITANEKAWGAALGTGDIATPKDMLVTDKAIHDELRPTTDGTYVKGSQTTAENLSKLDAQVKTNTDGISTNTTNITKNAGDITKLKNLSNITNEGEKVIKKLSKDAVKVEAGDRVTVTSTDNKETGTITYKVSANNNGTVTAGDQNLVSGDTVNTAINNAITNAGTATDTKLAGKANVDASNIGENMKDANGNKASDTEINKNKESWASAIGTNTVAKDNKQLVTSDAVATALEKKADKTYVDQELNKKADKTYVDKQLDTKANKSDVYMKDQTYSKSEVDSKVSDITTGLDGKAGKDLDNISDKGQQVIHNIAKDAVEVVDGTNTTVTKTEGTNTTPTKYAVNVEGKGKVAAGDTGLISGDTLYKEVHIDKDGAYIKGSQSVGQNLSNLDTGLKTTSDLIHTNEKGDTIQIGGNSTATKVDISGKDKDGKSTGRVITGVVSDVNDPNSAANVGYVNGITSASNEQIYHDMNMQYNHVENDISRAAAGSNALAALHPMQEFDPDDKAQFALGYGHYRNSNAGAVGAFYQPDENSMVNFGVSFGNGDAGINAGVTFKFGPGGSGHHALTKTQMAKVIDAQSKEIDELKKDNADKDKRIDALEQKMTEILAKLDKSKD